MGIHVQTLRTYLRGGKLPAMRLAEERAIRIRRADLEKVLEPVVPEIQWGITKMPHGDDGGRVQAGALTGEAL